MIENMNKLLEKNDLQVRIGSTWYRLDEIHLNDGKMPIFVSDEDGDYHEFDMADIEELESQYSMIWRIRIQLQDGIRTSREDLKYINKVNKELTF